MGTSQEIVQEIKKVARRRKKLLIFVPILFLGLSIGALYIIEPKYESSISILVQKEETLNPLVMYEMAMDIASEDRLKSFNEIIYSRSTMELLIDSLQLDQRIKSEVEKQRLVKNLRQNIVTSAKASDSFEITFYDTDPVRARDGVALLANHFIRKRLHHENNRNRETVEFFKTKMNELEQIVERQRDQIVSSGTEQMKETPVDRTALQNKLQSIEQTIEDQDWKIYKTENHIDVLKKFLAQEPNAISIQPLYRLPLRELPHGERIVELLSEYDGLKQRYTDSYPRIGALKKQIAEVAERALPAIESDLEELKMKRVDLKQQRESVIEDMEKTYIANQRNSGQMSNYSIYNELYNEMKVKLEQARMTRDIGNKSSEQFIVLDPPYIAKEPSSPNKRLVVLGGLFVGLIIASLLAAIAETMDTYVRTEEDLVYDKPIIAYLSDGSK
ncbi:MAG: GumC family protein [Bacteroidota bacterium]